MKPILAVILATLGTVRAGQIVLDGVTNAILNPGAELGLGSGNGNDIESVPDWTTTGGFTVVAYGNANAEINTSPGAAFGNNFFAGGPSNAQSSATQLLDVSNVSALIDAGLVDYTLSGYFGGYLTQADYATLSATFLDGSSDVLGVVTVGGANNETLRNGQTELLYADTTGVIPDGTVSILFTLTMTREEGNYNDGYADNLSFVAIDPPAGGDVPEPSAWMLTGLGGGALLLARRLRG